MKCPDEGLLTPIYIKTARDMPWPEEERAFYLLTRDGLFLCRNHPFFKSCVPADDWPTELAAQARFLEPRFPRISRKLLEEVVGFFDEVGVRFGAEATVLLGWNRRAGKIELIVPEQKATVGLTWRGEPYPIGVFYEIPAGLPPHLSIFGDIHSHVDEPAYASWTDKADEVHRAGLHVVVGRIDREPPEFHAEVVVDGRRFPLDPAHVFGGYRRRRPGAPRSWLEKVTVVKADRGRSSAAALDPGSQESSSPPAVDGRAMGGESGDSPRAGEGRE